MVYRPTRGEAPARVGPTVSSLPDIDPSVLDADVYRDPDRFEAEREQVFRTSWLIAARSSEIAQPGDWALYEATARPWW